MGSLSAEEISPPAGGELLCPWRQSNQNATGDAADGHFVPIGPLSPDPITGVIPWVRQKISGAQNLSGNLNSRRATGPWGCKNCRWCGSTSAPGYPSQRHRSESWREPQGAPLHKSHTDAVGEGLKVNCPEGAREATLGCAPPVGPWNGLLYAIGAHIVRLPSLPLGANARAGPGLLVGAAPCGRPFSVGRDTL